MTSPPIIPGVALITGSARGLGREVAGQLAATGCTVILTARDPAAAASTAAELAGLGDVRALPVGLDVADTDSVAAAAEAVGGDPGRLDVLINNAAAYVDWSETAVAADLDASRTVLDTNLYGPWRVVQAFLPLLRQSAHPRIVTITSGAGSHGDPQYGLTTRGGAAASYGISKAAANALVATLAAELAGTDVIVNAVDPDLTATYPGAENMGARPVADSAKGIVWAATLPDDGPRGGFFRDGQPLPW